jgi:hypothetical protein
MRTAVAAHDTVAVERHAPTAAPGLPAPAAAGPRPPRGALSSPGAAPPCRTGPGLRAPPWSRRRAGEPAQRSQTTRAYRSTPDWPGAWLSEDAPGRPSGRVIR